MELHLRPHKWPRLTTGVDAASWQQQNLPPADEEFFFLHIDWKSNRIERDARRQNSVRIGAPHFTRKHNSGAATRGTRFRSQLLVPFCTPVGSLVTTPLSQSPQKVTCSHSPDTWAIIHGSATLRNRSGVEANDLTEVQNSRWCPSRKAGSCIAPHELLPQMYACA